MPALGRSIAFAVVGRMAHTDIGLAEAVTRLLLNVLASLASRARGLNGLIAALETDMTIALDKRGQ